MGLTFLFPVLVGCRGVEAPGGRPPVAAPFVAEPWELPVVAYDRVAFEASLQVVIQELHDLSAHPIQELYVEVLSHRDAECPPLTVDLPDELGWQAKCVGEDGSEFAGSGTVVSTDRSLLVHLSGTVTAGGVTLSGRGAWKEEYAEGPELRTWTSELLGPVVARGGVPGPSWVSAGLLTDVEVSRSLPVDAEAPVAVAVDGSLAGLDAALSAAEVHLDLGDPETCAEPVGTVALRAPPGRWFELAFDGGDCDGCGDVSFRGVVVGQACADFRVWQTWTPPEGTP